MVNSERGALITSNSSGIKPRKVSETYFSRNHLYSRLHSEKMRRTAKGLPVREDPK